MSVATYNQTDWALNDHEPRICFPMLSRRIATARMQKRLSRSRFAKALGLDLLVLRAIETGKASPTMPTLREIAAFTGRSLGWFAGRG